MRISDLKKFPELIKDAWDDNGGSCPEYITFIQSKTNSPVKVPVLDAAQRSSISTMEGFLKPSMSRR